MSLIKHLMIGGSIAQMAATTVNAETKIDFAAHTNLTLGSSEIEESTLSTHAHDPNDEFTLQSIELSTVAQLNSVFSLRAAYNGFLDEDDHLDGEWEDAYLQATLPYSTRLQAGRIYNHTNSENSQHLHQWNFVNSSYLTSRFMGEEGLLTESVRLEWDLPTSFDSTLSLSFGDAVEHSHGHEEEEAHADEVHGEESNLSDDIFSIAYNANFYFTDFHRYSTNLHYSEGTNGYGRDSEIYGVGFSYQWRENGKEKGGKALTLSSEWIKRDVDYSSEDGSVVGNDHEEGISLSALYDFGNQWTVGLRHEHIQGSTEIEETPGATRNSLAATRLFTINDQVNGHVRLQYDHLKHDELEDSHTAWLQVQFNFGSAY